MVSPFQTLTVFARTRLLDWRGQLLVKSLISPTDQNYVGLNRAASWGCPSRTDWVRQSYPERPNSATAALPYIAAASQTISACCTTWAVSVKLGARMIVRGPGSTDSIALP